MGVYLYQTSTSHQNLSTLRSSGMIWVQWTPPTDFQQHLVNKLSSGTYEAIRNLSQSSVQWLKQRLGRVTAFLIHQVMHFSGKIQMAALFAASCRGPGLPTTRPSSLNIWMKHGPGTSMWIIITPNMSLSRSPPQGYTWILHYPSQLPHLMAWCPVMSVVKGS